MQENKIHLHIPKIIDTTSSTLKYPSNRFSVAPMFSLTDRHCRYFHRLLTKKTLLYSEMITTGAIINGKVDYLAYNTQENPVVLQLGGNDPKRLSDCAILGQKKGYSEINLNIGCPSNRVQNGRFGVCLMNEANLVADCLKAMNDVVSIPVTVKTRIGIDNHDSYEFLCEFVDTIVHKGGCHILIVHARKAWLSGCNPKENRAIPPINYPRVYQLKRDFPNLTIVINGEITTLEDIAYHLKYVDGVMIGREAYRNPSILTEIDHKIFDSQERIIDKVSIVKSLYPYIEKELSDGARLWHITRHILGLFQGMPGSRQWRRYLSEYANKDQSDPSIVERALSFIK